MGVEIQTTKYSEGIPVELPAYRRPLPFLYQSRSAERSSGAERDGGAG